MGFRQIMIGSAVLRLTFTVKAINSLGYEDEKYNASRFHYHDGARDVPLSGK